MRQSKRPSRVLPDYSRLPDLGRYLTPGQLCEQWSSFELQMQIDWRSLATFRTYREGARKLQAYLAEAGVQDDLLALSQSQMLAYRSYLVREHAPNTARTYWKGPAAFFGNRRTAKLAPSNWASPVVEIPAPPGEESNELMATDAEIAALLLVCDPTDIRGARDRAMILTDRDCGARREAMVRMRLSPEWLNLGEGYAFTINKGGEVVKIWIGPESCEAIEHWLPYRAQLPGAAETDDLWLAWNPCRPKDRCSALKPQSYYEILCRRSGQAGLLETGNRRIVHPHLFRHHFGHDMKSAGMSDADLQRAGSWKDPKSVARYAKSTADERITEIHRRITGWKRVSSTRWTTPLLLETGAPPTARRSPCS